jgi:hypothetical protein
MRLNPIVFLDFDGVVNTRFYYYKDGKLCGNFYHEEDMKVNNTYAINLLNKLCLETSSDIVVTSSWRKHTSKNNEFTTKKVLINSGLNEEINVLGDAPILDTSIGDEVRQWLTENNYPLDHPFIIIDDGCNPKEFDDRYIKTSFEKGFTENEYIMALDKLNSLTHQKRLFIKK